MTAPLDIRRLAPGDDAATVTAAQLREVVTRLITARHWQPGDADMWIVADAGYDGPRLAFLLADLPVKLLVRMRSDRVLRRPAPAEPPAIGAPVRAFNESMAFVERRADGSGAARGRLGSVHTHEIRPPARAC